MPLNRRQFLSKSSLILAAPALDLARVPGQAPAQAQSSFTPVRRTVGYFTGQGGTIGWHIGKESVIVVDSQFPATAKVCLEGINERTSGRRIDRLVNTHHHGDHTGGNGVFRPAVTKILAHSNVPKLQREAAARAQPGQGAAEPVVADATYDKTWREEIGEEVLSLKYYGPAHTSGDSVVTFEKANVVHMGDLVFNRRHPFIDRPAGASIANWIMVLEKTAKDHGSDTVYIHGHSSPQFGVTGGRADLHYMRDYLSALLEFVRSEIRGGKARDVIVKITDPLKGFADHGPLTERVLAAAYEEASAG